MSADTALRLAGEIADLRRERDAARKERDQAVHDLAILEEDRVELLGRAEKAEADYAAVAHAVDVEYVPDCGATAPGPVEAVLAAIESDKRDADMLADTRAKLEAAEQEAADYHAEIGRLNAQLAAARQYRDNANEAAEVGLRLLGAAEAAAGVAVDTAAEQLHGDGSALLLLREGAALGRLQVTARAR